MIFQQCGPGLSLEIARYLFSMRFMVVKQQTAALTAKN